MRLYIAVLDVVPDQMVPVLVAHSMLGAHLHVEELKNQNRNDASNADELTKNSSAFYSYYQWLNHSFKKCVVKVNQKQFDKIASLPYTYLGHENTVHGGKKTCAIPLPVENELLPSVLKYAELWKPKENENA